MRKIVGLSFLSAYWLAADAHAAPVTLFSDFGVADAFNCCSGYSLGGGASRGNGGFTVAAPFTASVTATLGRLDIGISVDATGNLSPNLNIQLLADAGGLPGAVLESFSLTGVATVAPIIVSANSATHPLLAGGVRYWVLVAPPDLLNSKDGWLLNTTSATASPFVAARTGAGTWGNGEIGRASCRERV